VGNPKYVPMPVAQVKDWVGSWGTIPNFGDFNIGGSITQKEGDTIHISFSDSGEAGGATGNPKTFKLPFAPLKIETDVDIAKTRIKLTESLVVTNTIFLESQGITLTLMSLVPGQTNVGNPNPRVIQYHRQWHEAQNFGVTKILDPQVPAGAPR
jgi:hypothetical protein